MKPLKDIVVIDLSRLIPGPFCSLILSDLGARVIHIDDPDRRDYLRDVGPALTQDGGALFEAFNRGKKQVSLSLRSSSDRAQLVKLLKTADVLLESFRPGVLSKIGFSLKELHKINPRLIVASLTGFGQKSSMSSKAGHDLNYLSLSGLLENGRVPLTQWSDMVGGGLFGALQVVAALTSRGKTGRGVHLDISLTHNMMFLGLARSTMAQMGTSIPLLEGTLARYRTYETADGKFVALAALESKFYNQFCELIGRPELKDERGTYPDAHPRYHHIFEKLFVENSRAGWEKWAAKYDVCLTPVLNPGEVVGSKLQKSGLPMVKVGSGKKKVSLPALPSSKGSL